MRSVLNGWKSVRSQAEGIRCECWTSSASGANAERVRQRYPAAATATCRQAVHCSIVKSPISAADVPPIGARLRRVSAAQWLVIGVSGLFRRGLERPPVLGVRQAADYT